MLTVALLGLGPLLQFTIPRQDEQQALAEELIGPSERVAMPGPAAFRAEDRAVLFFAGRGMSGAIEGAIVVTAEQISKVLILHSREGLSHTAFDTPGFLERFGGQSISHPVVADAVTGATISCQVVTDAVNERLSIWRIHANAEN